MGWGDKAVRAVMRMEFYLGTHLEGRLQELCNEGGYSGRPGSEVWGGPRAQEHCTPALGQIQSQSQSQ